MAPASTTRVPELRARSRMARRLRSTSAGGRPRRPSLEPMHTNMTSTLVR